MVLPMLQRLVVFSILFLVWILLSGNLDLIHLSMGVVSCAFVAWISGDLMFADRKKTVKQMVIEAGRLLVYVPWLLKEVVVANMSVLAIALAPGVQQNVTPRIVRYRTRLKSEFARFLLANSITLTPGTITIEMNGQDLYIHAINPAAAEGLEGPMERKIASIFGEDLDAA